MKPPRLHVNPRQGARATVTGPQERPGHGQSASHLENRRPVWVDGLQPRTCVPGCVSPGRSCTWKQGAWGKNAPVTMAEQ